MRSERVLCSEMFFLEKHFDKMRSHGIYYLFMGIRLLEYD